MIEKYSIISNSDDIDEKNNYSLFFLLYTLTVIVNYFTPDIARYTYFIGLLLFFYKSKSNSFWIAFFTCLIYAPAYLFNDADANFCLPLFGLPGLGRDIHFTEILILVILSKSLSIKQKIKTLSEFWILVIFSLLLFYVGFIWGMNTNKIFRTIRFLLPYTLFWSMPKLIWNTSQMRVVFNYFMIFVIPVILCQLYVIFFGQHLMFLLGGSFSGEKESLNLKQFDSVTDLIRPLYSTHILLLNIFYGIYNFMLKKSSYYNTIKYFFIYFILSFFSFSITGSRGYIIASVAMILLYFVFDLKKLKRNIIYLLTIISFFLILTIIPKVGKQFTMSIERILTVQSIINGDATANGTLKRITDRQPRVLSKVKESPIIGFGFSNTYYEFADGHVAFPTILLNGGIIGLLIFSIFIVKYNIKLYLVFLNSKNLEIISIIIGVIGFLIEHGTSYMVFSFAIGQGYFWAFVILLNFGNIIFQENKSIKYHF